MLHDVSAYSSGSWTTSVDNPFDNRSVSAGEIEGFLFLVHTNLPDQRRFKVTSRQGQPDGETMKDHDGS